MDVGTELRNGRERRGMSLAVLASSTKIGGATLLAMERGDFARLPGGVFTRGFLRAYAREVGLDPEEIVQHYLAEFESATATEHLTHAPDLEDGDIGPVEMEELERRSQRRQLVGGAVVLLLGPFLYFTFLGRHSVTPSSVAAQSPPLSVTPAKPEVRTSESAEETAVASPAEDRWAGALHLEIQPTDACWVSAISDGRQGLQRLMTAGEHETIDATDGVTLRLGDPSTCAFAINGAVASQPGKAGQPATLHITRQNYRDFLKPGLAAAAASGAPPARPSTPLAQNSPSAAPIPAEPAKVRSLSPSAQD